MLKYSEQKVLIDLCISKINMKAERIIFLISSRISQADLYTAEYIVRIHQVYRMENLKRHLRLIDIQELIVDKFSFRCKNLHFLRKLARFFPPPVCYLYVSVVQYQRSMISIQSCYNVFEITPNSVQLMPVFLIVDICWVSFLLHSIERAFTIFIYSSQIHLVVSKNGVGEKINFELLYAQWKTSLFEAEKSGKKKKLK